MTRHYEICEHYETCEGPIEGLFLPRLAWDVLRRENIRTIGELRAVAGQLERFDGIGTSSLRRISVETPSGEVSYPAPAAIRDQPRSYGRVPSLGEHTEKIRKEFG